MHVNRLNRNQRAQARSVLNDVFGDEPGIKDSVVCVNQDPFASIRFTPFRNIDNPSKVLAGSVITRLRACRKNPYLRLRVHVVLHVIRVFKLMAVQSICRDWLKPTIHSKGKQLNSTSTESTSPQRQMEC